MKIRIYCGQTLPVKFVSFLTLLYQGTNHGESPSNITTQLFKRKFILSVMTT